MSEIRNLINITDLSVEEIDDLIKVGFRESEDASAQFQHCSFEAESGSGARLKEEGG